MSGTVLPPLFTEIGLTGLIGYTVGQGNCSKGLGLAPFGCTVSLPLALVFRISIAFCQERPKTKLYSVLSQERESALMRVYGSLSMEQCLPLLMILSYYAYVCP